LLEQQICEGAASSRVGLAKRATFLCSFHAFAAVLKFHVMEKKKCNLEQHIAANYIHYLMMVTMKSKVPFRAIYPSKKRK
jgi:hypothetical protein